MKLAGLLLTLSEEQLHRLETEVLKVDETPPRGAVRDLLEGTIKNFKFIQEFVFHRCPPAFAIFKMLLDAPEHSVATDELRSKAWAETKRICELIDAGEILGRDDQLRLYRRVLREARRNDLQMDASESALLGVLRHELGISHSEHYLIEHHRDFREFWNHGEALSQELFAANALGLLFSRDGTTILAEDVAPLVRRALGLEMSTSSGRRLLEQVSSAGLKRGLSNAGERTSGGKDELIGRLIDNGVSVSGVLHGISLAELRDVCKAAGATVSGSKDELVERIVGHFAADLDKAPPVIEPEPPDAIEQRALDEQRFAALFMSLKGQDLGHILEAYPKLKQSGSKRTRVETLWGSRCAEVTLLGQLMSRAIEAALIRHRVKVSGSKQERAERLVDYFRSLSEEALAMWLDESRVDEVTPAEPPAPATPESAETLPTATAAIVR